MNEEWLAETIARVLVRLRARLAPENSRRQRWASAIYVPLLRRLGGGDRLRQIDPAPRCERPDAWSLPALPERPRVLLLKLDHIGDLILTLPALERLRAALPDADITLICGSWNRAFAERSQLADHVAVFDFFSQIGRNSVPPQDAQTLEQSFKALADTLGRFDLAIDLRHEPDTRLLLMQIDAGVRAGFSAHGEIGKALDISLANAELVTGGLGNKRSMHGQTRMLMLVSVVLDSLRPAMSQAQRLLAAPSSPVADRPYAVIAPGAGAPIRAWQTDRVAELAQRLHRQFGLDIALVGGSAEIPFSAQVAAALPAGAVHDLTAATDLADIPGILSGAALFVGMDSGLTHLAAGLDVPTVCIFSGVTGRAVWQPVGTRVRVVAGQAACSPCYLKFIEQCPHGRACLEVVDVDDVLAECAALLPATMAQ